MLEESLSHRRRRGELSEGEEKGERCSKICQRMGLCARLCGDCEDAHSAAVKRGLEYKGNGRLQSRWVGTLYFCWAGRYPQRTAASSAFCGGEPPGLCCPAADEPGCHRGDVRYDGAGQGTTGHGRALDRALDSASAAGSQGISTSAGTAQGGDPTG